MYFFIIKTELIKIQSHSKKPVVHATCGIYSKDFCYFQLSESVRLNSPLDTQ